MTNLATGCAELQQFYSGDEYPNRWRQGLRRWCEFNLAFCADGNADVAVFHNTSSATANYAYCVTDPMLQVLAILPDSTFDFDPLRAGLYRVYGISYAGNLPVQIGQSLGSTAPGYYSYSSNFVEVGVDSGCILQVCLLEDFKPGNSQAWAVWLKGLWGTPGYEYSFFRNSGMLIIYPDGTARLVGRIFNKADQRYQWDIDLSLYNNMNWNDWSALGRSYATPGKSFADSNHPFWEFWELDPSGNNTFTGVPGTPFTGKQLNITHRPANLYKGFQKGQGLMTKTECLASPAGFTSRAISAESAISITSSSAMPATGISVWLRII
ncbi:MAG: hypothetical protein R3B47_09080 [Bacteroidia bacterium]